MLIRMKTIMTMESPEPTLRLPPRRNSPSMMLPISEMLPPPRISEIAKVVMAGTKVIVMPLMMPGMLKGSSTSLTVRKFEAPRSFAASIRLLSILIITL